MNKSLLEKYEMHSIEELKLPSRISKLLITMRDGNSQVIATLYGTPGTGKTTSAKLISIGHDILYLSGSNDFGIEVMRTKVMPFCSGFGFDDKQKTLIIDEAENIKDIIQDSFKIIFDSCKRVNFIFITNEVGKINSAILSRSTKIEYDFYSNEIAEQQVNYVTFLKKICIEEKIAFDADGLREIYRSLFPDFRALLKGLQQIIDSDQSLTKESVLLMTESGKINLELYDIIENEKDSQQFYTKLTTYKNREKECFLSLSEPYFKYLNDRGKFELTLEVAETMCKYSNMLSTSLNKFTTFFGCCIALRNHFK